MKRLILSTILIIHYTTLIAQSNEFYPISKTNGTLHGTGIDWILDRADTCQFVFFGEQHGVEGIAEFVNFVYEQLQSRGFDHLALETDPWTTERCAKMGVNEFTKQNPHSIAFDSNGDIELMRTAIELNPTLEQPVWGMDQMQTAIHPFYRLIELANTPKQKRLARGAFLKATLKMGRYTRQHNEKDIEALEKAFSSNPSEEKELIIQELKQTIEIFTKWMNPETRQESVAVREELMKQNLNNYLKRLPNAKAVFKMGGAHTMYGIGPNGVPTLGDYAQKLANQNGYGTLNINVVRYNSENSNISINDFGDSQMLLVTVSDTLKSNLENNIRKSANGFDAIIYFKEASYASNSINRSYETQFRNNFIFRIIPLAITKVFCLITIIAFSIQTLRKNKNILQYPAIASVLAIGLVAFQITLILKPNGSAALSSGYSPLLIHITFGLATLYFLIQTYRNWKRTNISTRSKLVHTIFSINLCVLSYLIYYWNIGGMLGW
ncbi:hypothetical protein [Roseivirga thermotolerans]|uniref:Haem-binding uptake Tiki superfamily ChaN domain-containing protein n=1 Tax=Roseivirga thermotolerans TaxID=1758176 RepID=A0ABQ3IAZ7_9BACT|nr:hypothetical protein [Roseivirga thermotolerans]GHE71414.1 hypothetical protein GCM10011340_29240 [Roseivirga thermotolerans]